MTSATTPAHGTLSMNADGSFTYTPVANYNGPDSFNYTIADGKGGTASATVNITVTAVNDAPMAVNDSYNLGEDMILSLASAANGVLANDSDVDANTLTAVLVSSTSHGTLTLQPDGRFTYTPVANFNGPDTFTYRVTDGVADSAIATVTINVIPVNDAPQLANPGNKLVNELDPLTFTLSATDVDLPADTLTYAIASGVVSGMVLDAGTGAFAWMPTEAQGPGVYTLTFRVTDAAGAMSEQTIIITVSEVNVVPTITDVPAEATIPELVNFTFDGSGSDPDAPVQSLTFSLIGAPTGATIDATTGVFNWTPAENQGSFFM